MSRGTIVQMLRTFKENGAVCVKHLATDANIEESSIREWLYAMRSAGLVRVYDKRTQTGKSSGRSTLLWELTLEKKE